MTRYLKTLGLAFVAALAFSAVAASAASAVNHHFTGNGSDELTVVSNTPQIFEPETGSGEGYECLKVGVNGTAPGETDTSVTVEPKYSECFAIEEGKTTETPVFVETNSCHFTFTGETTLGNPTGGEHATVDVTCPAEQSITIRVTELKLKCAAVGTQEVPDAVRYSVDPEDPDAITVHATAHKVKSTTEGFACGSGEHTEGSYTGTVTVDAANGLTLSNT